MTGAKKGIPARDVGAYLSSVPHDKRMILEQLRRAIKAAAPNVEEVISYRIPTYKYRGPLVHFMAHKDYCSFIVASKAVVEGFKTVLAEYDISGTTIHFTPEHPLPAALVKKIVRARVKENELRINKNERR